MNKAAKSCDVLYIEGSGNVVSVLRLWKQGVDMVTETSITFSEQVLDFGQQNGLSIYMLAACDKPDSEDFGQFAARYGHCDCSARESICGDGSALHELQSKAREQGLSDHFIIHGRLNRPEIIASYQDADCTIAPSIS